LSNFTALFVLIKFLFRFKKLLQYPSPSSIFPSPDLYAQQFWLFHSKTFFWVDLLLMSEFANWSPCEAVMGCLMSASFLLAPPGKAQPETSVIFALCAHYYSFALLFALLSQLK
jgi:hypothetical protein